jgi:hypothetical protein
MRSTSAARFACETAREGTGVLAVVWTPQFGFAHGWVTSSTWQVVGASKVLESFLTNGGGVSCVASSIEDITIRPLVALTK